MEIDLNVWYQKIAILESLEARKETCRIRVANSEYRATFSDPSVVQNTHFLKSFQKFQYTDWIGLLKSL